MTPYPGTNGEITTVSSERSRDLSEAMANVLLKVRKLDLESRVDLLKKLQLRYSNILHD